MSEGAAGGGTRKSLSSTQIEVYFRLTSSSARERILSTVIPLIGATEKATLIEIRPGQLQLIASGTPASIGALREAAMGLGGTRKPPVAISRGREEHVHAIGYYDPEDPALNTPLAGQPAPGPATEPYPGMRPFLDELVGTIRSTEEHPEKGRPVGLKVGTITQGTKSYANALRGWVVSPSSAQAVSAAQGIAGTVLPVSGKSRLKQEIARLIAEAKDIIEANTNAVRNTGAPPSSPLAGAASANVTGILTGASDRISAAVLHIDRGLEAAGLPRVERERIVPLLMTYMRERYMWGGARRRRTRRRQRRSRRHR